MSKTRILNSEPTVGKARSALWARAKKQVSAAIDQEFFLEAIALQESMILDRIESLLQAHEAVTSATTLRGALNRLEKLGIQPFDDQTVDALKAWMKSRGEAIHQMVKLLEGYESSWSERASANRQTALAGRQLVNQIDRIVSKEVRALSKIAR